ncbi:hypothetical protein ACFSQ7_35575 [Paenibacillus rhizoplanae]
MKDLGCYGTICEHMGGDRNVGKKEERVLKQDAQEVHLHAEEIQELKIYNAMRSGMTQGKKTQQTAFLFLWGRRRISRCRSHFFVIVSSIGLPSGGIDDSGLSGSVQAASTKKLE